MSKKVKKTVTIDTPAVPAEDPDDIIDSSLFRDEALKDQQERHETINRVFDKAAEVISTYLDDPNADLTAKMFPAKLAADIYLAQEKFKREDEKLAIERKKLSLEQSRAGSFPSGGVIIPVQNNINGNVNIGEIKKKQDELLASFLPKTPVEEKSD